MKKFLVAGAMSSLMLASLSAKELDLEDLSFSWKGQVDDFALVEGKGINGESAVQLVAQDKYKKVTYGDSFTVAEGERMIASIDFKADLNSASKNKSFISLLVSPDSGKGDERILYSLSNAKTGYMALGYLPRWSQKFIAPKAMGKTSVVGPTPWLRMVVTIENQKKKIAAQATIYSLGEDGKAEPTIVHETKKKRQTKKGNWESQTDWKFSLGSGEINDANAKEVLVSKIDVKVQGI